MSKRKFDLSKEYDSSIEKNKNKAVAVHDVQDVQDVIGYGHTQGNRSGEKMKRINIILTPANYEFLKNQSYEHHVTLSKYFNYLLQKASGEQDVQDVDITYKVINNAKHRINMAFTDTNFLFVKNSAFDQRISPSSLVNQLIDKYRQY